MKAAVKKRWCRELRDPERKQVTGALCKSTGMCCLGVLLDTEIDGWWQLQFKSGTEDVFSFEDEVSEIPPSLLSQVGLTEDQQETLIDLNDIQRRSFGGIADWIEANL